MTVEHAFVDESIRPDGWYRLTVVRLRARDVDSVSRSVRSLVPTGRQRVHFSAEGNARRRQMLDGIARLPITATTFAAPHRRGHDEEPARRGCLDTMVEQLDATVVLLVLDSRGSVRDAHDRRTIRDALVRLDRSESLSYSHRGSSDELLLSLPDAIGWAVGAGGHFRRQVAGLVHEVFLGERG